jgi:uncharacterized protein YggT (Ycf19 family)
MKAQSIMIYLINVIIGIAQTIIGLRIILKLFGASAGAPFVRWLYETSQPLLHPFVGMFPSPVLDGNFVIEFSALFALIIYSLVGYFLTQFIIMLDAAIRKRQ